MHMGILQRSEHSINKRLNVIENVTSFFLIENTTKLLYFQFENHEILKYFMRCTVIIKNTTVTVYD